jgi:hypothetical protein
LERPYSQSLLFRSQPNERALLDDLFVCCKVCEANISIIIESAKKPLII